ncbi:MAG: hypothetical protein GJ676_18275 [Rhodobacteraceae bacterium]|nr:hypothetical protein [Paracoccaceae bacterium]
MLKNLLVATFVTSLSAMPVVAGNAAMKNADGTKLRIDCNGGGCKVKSKAKGQKWTTLEKTEGGRDNFLKLEEKYKAQGYN